MLEGGEKGVQFGEVRALCGLLALDGFDDGGEVLSNSSSPTMLFPLSKPATKSLIE